MEFLTHTLFHVLQKHFEFMVQGTMPFWQLEGRRCFDSKLEHVCPSFQTPCGKGAGRERERRETLSSLSMILKMTIFQILFHYSEVLTDVRLLGSNPYSVITSVFISSFSPACHTRAYKLKQRGIQQASVCLRSQNGIPGDSFPSTHESQT